MIMTGRRRLMLVLSSALELQLQVLPRHGGTGASFPCIWPPLQLVNLIIVGRDPASCFTSLHLAGVLGSSFSGTCTARAGFNKYSIRIQCRIKYITVQIIYGRLI